MAALTLGAGYGQTGGEGKSLAPLFLPCDRCGAPMPGVRGRKDAICQVCGLKDACC